MSTTFSEISVGISRNFCLNFRDRLDENVCFCDEIIKTPTRYGIAARIDDNSGFNKINSAYAPLYRVCDCLITGHALRFADEARFGRINRPRPCWAPIGTRPEVASQLIREYIYLYGAVCPKDGTCVYLIMPTSNTACFQAFIDVLSRKFARRHILLVLDGAPNHRCGDLALPDNISLLFLPPYSPELNPKENLWDEIREKIFKNYALKSIDAVRAKLKQAILYIERNPKIVKSITSFPYIVRSI